MKIVIECAPTFASALAQDLRGQIPEEIGLTVTGEDGRVVIDGCASQRVAEGLAGSLNRSLPEGVQAKVVAS